VLGGGKSHPERVPKVKGWPTFLGEGGRSKERDSGGGGGEGGCERGRLRVGGGVGGGAPKEDFFN